MNDACKCEDPKPFCDEQVRSNVQTLPPKDAAGNLIWSRIDADSPEVIVPRFENDTPMLGRLVCVKGTRPPPNRAVLELDQHGSEVVVGCGAGPHYIAYDAAAGSAALKVLRVPVPQLTKWADEGEVTRFTFTKITVTNTGAQKIVSAKADRRFLSLQVVDTTATDYIHVGNSDVTLAQLNGWKLLGAGGASGILNFGINCPMPRHRGELYADGSVAAVELLVVEGF